VDRRRGQLVLPISFLACFILSELLYERALTGFFVLDDFAWLDCALETRASLSSLFNLHISNFFRPLAHAYFAALLSLIGPDAFGFHIASLVLHSANALLFSALVLRLSRLPSLAVFAALAFVLLPTYTEAVIWVSGVTEPIAALPMLLALLTFRRYLEGPPSVRGWPAYLATVLFFALALLAKESTVALLPLLALLHLGLRLFGRARPVGLLPTYLPLAALLCLYLAFQLRVQQESYLVQHGLFSVGPHAFAALGHGLRHLARRSWPILLPPVLLAVLGRGFGAVPLRETLKLVALFLAALVATMAPYTLLVGGVLASRYFYLPAMIVALALALGLQPALVGGRRNPWRVLPPLCLIGLVPFSIVTASSPIERYLLSSQRTSRFVRAAAGLPLATGEPVALLGSPLAAQPLRGAMHLFYNREGYTVLDPRTPRSSSGRTSSAWLWDEAHGRFLEVAPPSPRR
jgi:hypothetical protein